MTDEAIRQQKRAELQEKARRIQEADRQSRAKRIDMLIEARRSIRGPYSPEAFKKHLDRIRGGNRRTAISTAMSTDRKSQGVHRARVLEIERRRNERRRREFTRQGAKHGIKEHLHHH